MNWARVLIEDDDGAVHVATHWQWQLHSSYDPQSYYPIGWTLCHCKISQLLFSYELGDSRPDTRPVDCEICIDKAAKLIRSQLWVLSGGEGSPWD